MFRLIQIWISDSNPATQTDQDPRVMRSGCQWPGFGEEGWMDEV
jgi:hypothetical protein